MVTVRHSRPGVGKLPLKPAVYCRMYSCVSTEPGVEGDTILAEDVGGDALTDALLVDRIGKREIAVDVCVDEAGQTTLPAASMISLAVAVPMRATAVMRSSEMPTSAMIHGRPDPSTTRPLRMRMSNMAGWCSGVVRVWRTRH